MMHKIRPLHDRVLIKRFASEEKSGDLYIPDNAKEKGQIGEVVAVGPGRRTDKGVLIPNSVKPGDRVLFGKYAGEDLNPKQHRGIFFDDDHLFLRDDEIQAVIPPTAEQPPA